MNPYYQDSAVTIYHGDCREIVPTLGRFDLLLTDPPYGIDYNPKRSQSSAASGKRKELLKIHGDTEVFNPTFVRDVADKSVLWGANNYAHYLPPSNGWLFWDKRDGGTVFKGFVASDGEMAWSDLSGRVRVFSHRWCGHLRDSERKEFLHPTQKPLVLMSWCIGLAGDVQTILDPFAGSGTTGRAAKDLGRKAVLIEREERYCEIAAKRMGQEVLNFNESKLT